MNSENINELEIDDLVKGYKYNKETNEYRCLFCEKIYEDLTKMFKGD